MQWIISNVSWIKDVLWIFFTLVATIIAVLTYKRARYTLLQPLRSEVVKRQTELLVELLEYISNPKGSIYFAIDYMGIIACNTYKLLELCDYVLSDKSVNETVSENISGFIFLKDNGEINTFTIPTDPFESHSEDVAQKQLAYRKRVKEQIQLKRSIAELEGLYLTKQHSETLATLERFRDNPFMPKSIQQMLNQLLEDIQKNIRGPLFEELEKFIVRIESIESDKDHPINITYQAMYNDFLRYCKSHTKIISEITNSVREYLLVDAKWS